MTPAVVIIAVACAAAGSLIGSRKGHPVWGFFLGLLLSVIGLAVIAVTKPSPEYRARQDKQHAR